MHKTNKTLNMNLQRKKVMKLFKTELEYKLKKPILDKGLNSII